ncbi:methyltransferase [Pseudoprimorskyibacter insulae]|uniref:Trans-aconitate 2-methyltransferase n=1 Tax=Pseudoprimorskyibacter insulae TaxID=1695997 RepID=A0A2R8AXT1_9RHOB|nr:methyltransferase [Pseudoprimorskyibacter insulae]SPF80852.1 Trans-aconitate 2-methyltransferase [Pseudoprimorskyibacter insulae]
MAGHRFSSGYPAADRRADFAETLMLSGDAPAATEVLRGALDLVPDWGAGWFRLGELHEAAGDEAAAVEAWTRAVEIDPADPFGAGVKRDLLRKVSIVETLPPAFVELLFDQYAPRFETSLLNKLEYRGPSIVADALARCDVGHVARAMDLGCGTGLLGDVLRPLCGWLEGVDISSGMLAEASVKQVYDWLEKVDIATLDIPDRPYDLIIASDVFNYIGALEQVIGWCAGAIAPLGQLIFTVELGDDGVMLQDCRRFTHSESYVRTLLRDAGFARASLSRVVLRRDRGQDVVGLCVIASRSGGMLDRMGDGEDAIPA